MLITARTGSGSEVLGWASPWTAVVPHPRPSLGALLTVSSRELLRHTAACVSLQKIVLHERKKSQSPKGTHCPLQILGGGRRGSGRVGTQGRVVRKAPRELRDPRAALSHGPVGTGISYGLARRPRQAELAPCVRELHCLKVKGGPERGRLWEPGIPPAPSVRF